MEETIKWGAPTYVVNKQNVMGLAAFKSYVGIWFFQGALLKDEQGVLMNAQEGKTAAMRQLRFATLNEIVAKEKEMNGLIQQAIALAKAGTKVAPKKGKPLEIPQELQQALDADKKLLEAFEQFTLSKKREFTDHVASAKREATRLARLEKIKPMILAGTGLHDKYRKC
jgi:uncharacterized protein YdeI (YjbR/CyaY-like superfamily)